MAKAPRKSVDKSKNKPSQKTTSKKSLAKSINLREQMRIDFRWEAFNLLNRVRFGTGPTKLSDPNLGRLTSNSDLLNTPRTLQMAAKLYF